MAAKIETKFMSIENKPNTQSAPSQVQPVNADVLALLKAQQEQITKLTEQISKLTEPAKPEILIPANKSYDTRYKDPAFAAEVNYRVSLVGPNNPDFTLSEIEECANRQLKHNEKLAEEAAKKKEYDTSIEKYNVLIIAEVRKPEYANFAKEERLSRAQKKVNEQHPEFAAVMVQ
jgi:hypothetical protein